MHPLGPGGGMEDQSKLQHFFRQAIQDVDALSGKD